MRDQLTFLVVPRNEVTEPIGRVELQKLREWGAEAEVVAGAGTACRGGKWRLELVPTTSEAKAVAVYGKARLAGCKAELKPERRAGEPGFKVEIVGLTNELGARALATRLATELGIEARVAT